MSTAPGVGPKLKADRTRSPPIICLLGFTPRPRPVYPSFKDVFVRQPLAATQNVGRNETSGKGEPRHTSRHGVAVAMPCGQSAHEGHSAHQTSS